MRGLLLIITLPWTLLVSWPWVLLMRLFAARELRWDDDGVLTAVWRGWVFAPRRWLGNRCLWRWSTTIGRGIIYQPTDRREDPEDSPTAIEDHEHVHVRQVEDHMLTSFVVGLLTAVAVGAATGDWGTAAWVGPAIWFSGGGWQVPDFLASGCRHGFTLEGIYEQAEHERSARAQADRWCSGRSWLSHRRLR